jgi:hypothetical protein
MLGDISCLKHHPCGERLLQDVFKETESVASGGMKSLLQVIDEPLMFPVNVHVPLP